VPLEPFDIAGPKLPAVTLPLTKIDPVETFVIPIAGNAVLPPPPKTFPYISIAPEELLLTQCAFVNVFVPVIFPFIINLPVPLLFMQLPELAFTPATVAVMVVMPGDTTDKFKRFGKLPETTDDVILSPD
jgi:hypothetical protein